MVTQQLKNEIKYIKGLIDLLSQNLTSPIIGNIKDIDSEIIDFIKSMDHLKDQINFIKKDKK